MLLDSLLRQFDANLPLAGLANIEIKGIREDSRQVRAGDLFVARGGTKADGRRFVADAAARGAVAVVAAEKIPDCPIPQITVGDITTAASALANIYFERPSDIVKTFGITGTNGKTTTAYLIRHILSAAGRRCGMIGTVEVDDGQSCRQASMTTPSAVEVGELLAQMRDQGCWSCAMEVSSHALHQGRVAGVRFAAAAFTNLTRDHLDYHKTMENYCAAKAMLFNSLDASAVAVVNAHDKWTAQIVRDCKARVISFGIGRKGDYRANHVEINSSGSKFILEARWQRGG